MQTKRVFQVTVLSLAFSAIAYSQKYSEKIVDGENEAIGFAHIFFLNDQSRGAISNDNGEFSITVKEENKENTLIFKC